MNSSFASRRVAVFFGAIKWFPILAVPFGVFFFETWLQVCIYERDYAATELKSRIKEISSHIGRLQERADELMALKSVSEHVPDLGLVPIEPGQVEVLRAPYTGDQIVSPYDFFGPMTIADAAPIRHTGNPRDAAP
ncbi:MAG: hypothetical protein SGI88_07850 [Candidatus Hydrogenedentes bacterium]|nr:hypothetical protein [Candidatus Hydrogenedentota bacterium]